MTEKTTRWYPTQMQLGKQTKEGITPTADSLERAFREVLRLHYELLDSHQDLLTKFSALNGKKNG